MGSSPGPPVVVWDEGTQPATTLRERAHAAGRADLAVVLPGVEPSGTWLERLVAAAHSDSTIATASAMLTGGPLAPSPLPVDGVGAAAAIVAARSGGLRPRISEPQAGCVLLRRTALDLAVLDDAPGSTTAAVLADFGQRCTALGLAHVLADDVLAAGQPTAPLPDETTALDARHPHRAAALALDMRAESPVEHALLVASRGLDPLSVTIDGRVLSAHERDGTQVHALGLIAALGRSGRVALRVVTPPDLDPQARAALEQVGGLTLLSHEAAAGGSAAVTDVVHRPNQVFAPADLELLVPLGRRMVVTQQDLILYRTAAYHDSVERWLRFRRVTEHTLAAVDHVVFFSEHASRDALADGLVDQARSSVVPIGVDRSAGEPARRPPRLPDDDLPFLFCLGADLPHKNQAFAAGIVDALRSDHGWDGRLVCAGPANGGGEPAAVALQLGSVGEGEKAWLLEHAAAAVYPTLYEGFGLIPFEAAAAGTPCLFAAQAALGEVLPASTTTLVAWDTRASAAAAAPLLAPGPARSAHVDALREAARRYRWDDTAQALIALYEHVLVAPPRELRRGRLERLALERSLAHNERLREDEWRRFSAFREEVGSDGLGLVGPGGVLAPADRRALLALLSRGGVRRPVLGVARAAYRLGLALRRRG